MTATETILIELAVILCLAATACYLLILLGAEEDDACFWRDLHRDAMEIVARYRGELEKVHRQRAAALDKANRVNAERRANHQAKVRDKAAELRAEFPIATKLTVVCDE